MARDLTGTEARVVRGLAPSLLRWFAAHARDLPWRRTLDPYAIWISEVMLQQTQVKTVIPYWKRWMRALPTVQALARAPRQRVLRLWAGLGYYHRAHNLQRAAQLIVIEHGGRFPETFECVLALPGVGRYTAGAVCSTAFNQPTPVLDGNVTRVLSRLFAIKADPRSARTQRRLWQLAESFVQAAAQRRSPITARTPGVIFSGRCSALNQALMELGSLVCTPRRPQCSRCPLRAGCAAFRLGTPETFPARRVAPKTTRRRVVAWVVEHDGHYLVHQRPAGVINAHLWEFPNVEMAGDDVSSRDTVARRLGLKAEQLQSLGVIQHTITRYRVEMEVFAARLKRRQKAEGRGQKLRTPPPVQPEPGLLHSSFNLLHSTRGVWLTCAKLARLPFTGAHRKILARLTGRNAEN